MTTEKSESFLIDEGVIKGRLLNRLGVIRKYWKPDSFHYYRLHPRANNLEVIMGPDLAVNLPAMPANVPSEERARRFLLEWSEDLGFADPFVFRRQLSVKHTMKSSMGSHCIFELRDQSNKEILPSFFAVHMDFRQRVVMLHCAYQNSIDPQVGSGVAGESIPPSGAQSSDISDYSAPTRRVDIPESRAWERQLRQQLQDRFKDDPNVQIQNVVCTYDIWLPDWKAERYVRGCQAKVQTNVGDYVFLILLRDQSWDIVSYAAVSKFGPSGFALGIVYAEFWKDQQELESQLLTTQVVLRDLDDTRGGLHGKYVSVEDNLTDVLLDDADSINWRINPDSLRSGFDRVMAYYHVNLAQRYFRQLGLTVLDDDPYLNPLQVVLTGRAGSSVGAGYRPDRKAIVLRELFDSSNPDTYREWTLARDARILYHEYVHAVTDSLARLQRVNKSGTDCDNIRLLEMTQSVAMDEGLADYFACSLTERQGAHPGEYGNIISVAGGFYWVLGQRRIDVSKANLKSVINASADDLKKLCQSQTVSSDEGTPKSLEEQYYLWGTIWASFLWKLRDGLGPDVADTIIAHSILFLSRWSGFLVGVCALIQADHLLFSGLYRDTIIELAGLDEELRRQMIEHAQARQQPLSKDSMVRAGLLAR